MAFIYEAGSTPTDAGELRGRQVDIACLCTFEEEGIGRPYLIKLENEAGEIETIKDIRVYWEQQKNYGDLKTAEFDCGILLDQRRLRVKLLFLVMECRWVMIY